MNCSFKHIIIFLWCFAAWGKVAASSIAGRMTNDSQKGTVAYNHLGLVKSVTKGSDVLKYTYDATGPPR
ncbi:MAG: hypothetical protein LBL04_06045 [Bacteroidales bacterium]|jgi:hypothetical protein|nr:hypothetical protein [Bacteroidales bacterium]